MTSALMRRSSAGLGPDRGRMRFLSVELGVTLDTEQASFSPMDSAELHSQTETDIWLLVMSSICFPHGLGY